MCFAAHNSIGGLVVEYIVAIDVTWVRFPADASCRGVPGEPWVLGTSELPSGQALEWRSLGKGAEMGRPRRGVPQLPEACGGGRLNRPTMAVLGSSPRLTMGTETLALSTPGIGGAEIVIVSQQCTSLHTRASVV